MWRGCCATLSLSQLECLKSTRQYSQSLRWKAEKRLQASRVRVAAELTRRACGCAARQTRKVLSSVCLRAEPQQVPLSLSALSLCVSFVPLPQHSSHGESCGSICGVGSLLPPRPAPQPALSWHLTLGILARGRARYDGRDTCRDSGRSVYVGCTHSTLP